MKRSHLILLLLLLFPGLNLQAAERKIKINKDFISFPISQAVGREQFTIQLKNKTLEKSVIRLTDNKPDYWVFYDVSQYKGKTLTLTYNGRQEALDKVVLSDTIMGEERVYEEPMRPQYHFTTRRGWINDPNGLVYYAGTYHLFYQHNPFEREWENMHWGHAVSRDLLHWTEWPDAMAPDSLGSVFSGSAVIDYNNTAELNKRNAPAMIAYYTADLPQYERQCMAYSYDEGRTFTRYEGNPVIDSHEKWQSRDTRDPKIFWYAPGKHWVLVLCERDGHSIYNSIDLKHWTYESHQTGFWECPDLFELPVDGNPANTRWVLWGASGTYMLGTFDGKKFTPDGPKLRNVSGSAYAAQTINGLPESDGRVIKIAWGRLSFGDKASFNGCMLLPQEQSLRTTSQSIRLFSKPIREIDQLFTPVATAKDLNLDEANKLMRQFDRDELLRIKVKLHLTYATDAGLRYNDHRIVKYDMNGNLLNDQFYVPDSPGSMDLDAEVYIDHGVVEVFIDGGAYSYSMNYPSDPNRQQKFSFYGNQTEIKSLEVARGKSIWKQ